MSTDCDDRIQFEAATKRHPEFFEHVYYVREVLINWIDRPELKESPKDALGSLRLSAALRAWNLFKAVVPLLERDFWEDALILVRSLFELLVNIEYVERVESERESRARRFFLFEELQKYQGAVALHEYCVHTKRAKSDEKAARNLEAMARKHFAVFLHTGKNGKTEWARSWCGKNVRELAEASSEPIRVWQYKVLYAYSSGFVHQTPMGVLSTLHRKDEKTSWDESASKELESNFESLQMTTSLLLSFLLEIILHVSAALPKFSAPVLLDTIRKLYAIWGIEPPTRKEKGNMRPPPQST